MRTIVSRVVTSSGRRPTDAITVRAPSASSDADSPWSSAPARPPTAADSQVAITIVARHALELLELVDRQRTVGQLDGRPERVVVPEAAVGDHVRRGRDGRAPRWSRPRWRRHQRAAWHRGGRRPRPLPRRGRRRGGGRRRRASWHWARPVCPSLGATTRRTERSRIAVGPSVRVAAHGAATSRGGSTRTTSPRAQLQRRQHQRVELGHRRGEHPPSRLHDRRHAADAEAPEGRRGPIHGGRERRRWCELDRPRAPRADDDRDGAIGGESDRHDLTVAGGTAEPAQVGEGIGRSDIVSIAKPVLADVGLEVRLPPTQLLGRLAVALGMPQLGRRRPERCEVDRSLAGPYRGQRQGTDALHPVEPPERRPFGGGHSHRGVSGSSSACAEPRVRLATAVQVLRQVHRLERPPQPPAGPGEIAACCGVMGGRDAHLHVQVREPAPSCETAGGDEMRVAEVGLAEVGGDDRVQAPRLDLGAQIAGGDGRLDELVERVERHRREPVQLQPAADRLELCRSLPPAGAARTEVIGGPLRVVQRAFWVSIEPSGLCRGEQREGAEGVTFGGQPPRRARTRPRARRR